MGNSAKLARGGNIIDPALYHKRASRDLRRLSYVMCSAALIESLILIPYLNGLSSVHRRWRIPILIAEIDVIFTALLAIGLAILFHVILRPRLANSSVNKRTASKQPAN